MVEEQIPPGLAHTRQEDDDYEVPPSGIRKADETHHAPTGTGSASSSSRAPPQPGASTRPPLNYEIPGVTPDASAAEQDAASKDVSSTIR